VYPLDTLTDGRHVVLRLSEALRHSLDASSAILRGNIVEATHGETVEAEGLGDGDAAVPFQLFTLKETPVTFVPNAEAIRGAGTTLELRVNGVAWVEVPNLHGQSHDAQVFTTRLDDENNLLIQFGDGATGARLPTGRDNLTATYRKGLGPGGNVRAGALKTLLDRLKGLKSVVNPEPASGGANGEAIVDARGNAPNSVRLFDRIVSLRDFEDAARAYAGIAKARASLEWDGEQRAVQLVVAGDDGTTVESTVREDLMSYLDERRDPNRSLRLVAHRNVPLRIAVAIELDSRYEADAVESGVRDALVAHFAFENQDLGASVHLSDIYAIVQSVAGVLAVDVNALQYKRTPDRIAHGASTDDKQEHLPLLPSELPSLTAPLQDVTVSIGLANATP
jgi:predicted phage baseplate assembly protein